MGVLKEHAILVTGYYGDYIDRAHAKATELFDPNVLHSYAAEGALVTPIQRTPVNSVRSFAILPDGSKEGSGTSDAGNDARTQMVEWLRAEVYDDDGSSPLSWVEVQYGDETHRNSRALRSSDTDRKRYRKRQDASKPS